MMSLGNTSKLSTGSRDNTSFAAKCSTEKRHCDATKHVTAYVMID